MKTKIIDNIKASLLFKKRVTVFTETGYLFSSQKNKLHLLKSINEAKTKKGKKINLDDLWGKGDNQNIR